MSVMILIAGVFLKQTPAQTPPAPQTVPSYAATAEPPIPRPQTQPLRVPLFRNMAFTDFAPKAFAYSPPPGAKRWGKVILTADFSVTAGRQFDRTAQIAIGGTNVFFGTTAEPSPTVAPHWHVERDLTDYTALFAQPRDGEVTLGNVVDATYTGVIRGTAALLFYPTGAATPAPETPDLVLPLPTPGGNAAHLAAPSDLLSGTFTLPTNVVRAYLDIITQSQGRDEFWYTNVPDDLAAKLQQNGGTAFREAEVTLDDRPAGVAPVFPWVYTGGIDPSLWRPIPGVQTLNLMPYRVDLTPFAGVLSDGRPHRIGLRVFNAADYFAATGTLLLCCDPHRGRVVGAVTENTLSTSPTPTVGRSIALDEAGDANGVVSVTSSRRFTVGGYVLTSRGRITTRIVQSLDFSNGQQYVSIGPRNTQNIHQQTRLVSTTTTTDGIHRQEVGQCFSFPFTLDVTSFAGKGKASAQATTIRQGYNRTIRISRDGHPVFSSALTDEVRPADIVFLDGTGRRAKRAGQRSAQIYLYDDSRGSHVHRFLTAVDGLLKTGSGGRSDLGE